MSKKLKVGKLYRVTDPTVLVRPEGGRRRRRWLTNGSIIMVTDIHIERRTMGYLNWMGDEVYGDVWSVRVLFEGQVCGTNLCSHWQCCLEKIKL